MHHVILGAGPAGVTAAETLRKHAPDSRITLIGGEPGAPYARMAIPYLLEGKIDESGTRLRHVDDHYASLGIDYRQGPVTGLDPAAKSVTCADGSTLGYDKLLIATGATPVAPPIKGLDCPGVHTCWTLEDARQIAKYAEPGAPVVLIGAGFIGSIILESLATMGVDLTVVEMGDRMVPRMLDETAGKMLQRWCEAKGVRILTDARVDSIAPAGTPGATDDRAAQGDKPGLLARIFGGGGKASAPAPDAAEESNSPDAALTVTLQDGQSLPANLVVVAAGVKSNIAFLEGSGVETDIGVKVNAYHETSVPDVYAAGDAAEGIDLSTGHTGMLAIQPVAVEHGQIAALNMCGHATRHRGSLNMNVLDTLGLVSSSFGAWEGVDGGTRGRMVDEAGYRYLRLEFDGNRLVGAQCVGMVDHIGVLRGLIQSELQLGSWEKRLIAAPERVAEAYVFVAQGRPSAGPTGPQVALPA